MEYLLCEMPLWEEALITMRSIVMLLKKCALITLSAVLLLASTYVGPAVPSAQASTGCFAVYCQDDQSLRFYKRASVPRAGSVFEGRSVAAVYTGFETANYVRTRLSSRDHAAPWAEYASKIKTVTVVDSGISPRTFPIGLPAQTGMRAGSTRPCLPTARALILASSIPARRP